MDTCAVITDLDSKGGGKLVCVFLTLKSDSVSGQTLATHSTVLLQLTLVKFILAILHAPILKSIVMVRTEKRVAEF